MLQDVVGQPAAHRQKLTESVCSPLICCVSAVSFHLQLEVKGQTPPYLNPTRPERKKWLEVTFTGKYCTVLKYFRCFHVWCWSQTHWLWRLCINLRHGPFSKPTLANWRCSDSVPFKQILRVPLSRPPKKWEGSPWSNDQSPVVKQTQRRWLWWFGNVWQIYGNWIKTSPVEGAFRQRKREESTWRKTFLKK